MHTITAIDWIERLYTTIGGILVFGEAHDFDQVLS